MLSLFRQHYAVKQLLWVAFFCNTIFSFHHLNANFLMPLAENHTLNIVDGYLEVPLDWNATDDRSTSTSTSTIQIKYRVLHQGDKPLPWLFFIGGGPGMESITSYHQNPAVFLAKHFRVVLFDQRGTGGSTPIDHHHPQLDPLMVAQFFSAAQIVPDLNALIGHLAGQEPYLLMGHSFGGIIANYYLLSPQTNPNITGVVYLSSPPLLDTEANIFHRLLAQKKMSENLSDDQRQKILALRWEILQRRKTNPLFFESYLDARFTLLDGPKQLDMELAALSEAAEKSDDYFLKALTNNWLAQWNTNRFGPIISEINAPYLIDDLASSRNALDLEAWMLTEASFITDLPLMRDHLQGIHYQDIINIAKERYMATYQLSRENLRKVLTTIPVVVFLAANDLYVPFSHTQEEFQSIFTEEFHQILTLENGGHYSALEPIYLEFILKYLRQVQHMALDTNQDTNPCNLAFTTP